MRFGGRVVFAALAMCACSAAFGHAETVNSAVAPRSEVKSRSEVVEAVMPAHRGSVVVPTGARSVTLDTDDGYRVAGWYFAPTAKPAPGVILLHQRGRDKSSWGDLPQQLVRQGFAVISIDLRGHGQTLGLPPRPSGGVVSEKPDFLSMLQDVAAADVFLSAQPGVQADRIGIIGASLGANLAIVYLADDRRVRTAVALSPSLDYGGLRPLEHMRAVDKRPLYLIASRGDKHSADCAAELSAAGTPDGPKSLRLFDGDEHGTDLLDANEGLDRTIASGWLLNYLPPQR